MKIILICIVLTLFLVTSCGSTVYSASKATDASDCTLSFRITWTAYSGRGEAIWNIVDAYNTENESGCCVSVIDGDEDITAIKTLLESDSETIFALPYRYVSYFSQEGYLMDLTEAFQDAEELFYPEIWELGTNNGQTYGIPWLGHSMCLLYNKNLLEEAGVNGDDIRSLDDLLDAIIAVEANTDAKGIGLVGADSNDLSWMVNQFVYGFGSSLVSDDGKTVAINNDNTKAALTFYRDVLGEHAQPTWIDDTGLEVMAYFRNQEIAFEIQSIWGITDVQKNGAAFDIGVIPMKDIGLCSEIGPIMLAIPANIDDSVKEEAFQFIRYMISQPAQEKIMYGEYDPERDTSYPFRIPIRTDMADSQIFKSNPDYVKFLTGFEYPSVDVPVPAWQTIKDELYQPGLHQYMLGEITADALLEELDTNGNVMLQE